MKSNPAPASHHTYKTDRRLQTALGAKHDPYQAGGKPKAPAVCSECGLVYTNGRWQKGGSAPAHTHRQLCPACQRVRDDAPAGFLTIEDPQSGAHHAELLRTVRNVETRKRGRHPLQRIMRIEEQRDRTTVTTTDGRLTLDIAHAIKSAFGGEVEYQMQEGNFLMRARWHGNA